MELYRQAKPRLPRLELLIAYPQVTRVVGRSTSRQSRVLVEYPEDRRPRGVGARGCGAFLQQWVCFQRVRRGARGTTGQPQPASLKRTPPAFPGDPVRIVLYCRTTSHRQVRRGTSAADSRPTGSERARGRFGSTIRPWIAQVGLLTQEFEDRLVGITRQACFQRVTSSNSSLVAIRIFPKRRGAYRDVGAQALHIHAQILPVHVVVIPDPSPAGRERAFSGQPGFIHRLLAPAREYKATTPPGGNLRDCAAAP